MKRRYITYRTAVLLLAFTTLFSCKKQLEEINQNPNTPSTISAGPLFTNLQVAAAGDDGTARRTNLGYCMMMVQQTATLKTDDLYGDKYLKNDLAGYFFDYTYTAVIKNLDALLELVKKDAEQVNTYAMARIWKVMIYHRLTDLYGAVPYVEGGKGYSGQIYFPAYSNQQEIYNSMLKELEESVAQLDPAKPTIGAADLIYKGEVAQWKKLGNSLMLRLGMRLSKINETDAKKWVSQAVSGGVLTTYEDNCKLPHDKDRGRNPLGNSFEKFDLIKVGDVKISKTFLDFLNARKDPRTRVYVALPTGDTVVSHQRGLPNGYDVTTITNYPGGGLLASFSNPNQLTLLLLDAPTFFLSSSENKLLMAEAAAKGWITTGSAQQYYKDAVTASMAQMAAYGVQISAQEVNNFINNNPYPVAGPVDAQVKFINEEFWVASFLNGFESYANWRRTGIPALTPVNYTGNGTGGTIPRRLLYPVSEYSSNKINLQKATQQQGADELTTRMWWDK